MDQTIRNRIKALEDACGTSDNRCPECAASDATYMALEQDGTMTPRCMHCGVEHEPTAVPTKGYPRELIEAWP